MRTCTIILIMLTPGCGLFTGDIVDRLAALQTSVERTGTAAGTTNAGIERVETDLVDARARLGALAGANTRLAERIEAGEPLSRADIKALVDSGAERIVMETATRAGAAALSGAVKGTTGIPEAIQGALAATGDGIDEWQILLYALAAYIVGSGAKGTLRAILAQKKKT